MALADDAAQARCFTLEVDPQHQSVERRDAADEKKGVAGHAGFSNDLS